MNLLSILSLSLAPLLATSAPAPTPASTPSVALVAADSRVEVIPGFGTQDWTLRLPSGENTHIVVDGDGDSDLDAYLFDENGNLIALDDDGTDYCILDVFPRWTGTFTLRIVNRGSRANLYVLSVD